MCSDLLSDFLFVQSEGLYFHTSASSSMTVGLKNNDSLRETIEYALFI